MALSRYTTFTDGEVLFAADLEGEFDNIVGSSQVGWPATENRSMGGFSLILDSDGDTYIAATSDDIVTVVSQSNAAFRVDGSVAIPVNGVKVTASATTVAPKITAIGETHVDLDLGAKGSGEVSVDGVAYATTTKALLAYRVFG